MSRVDGYGRIDRSRTVTVTVDGTAYTGHPGDTVASVLLAHDARPQNTSVKYGRPRGIGAAWTEDPVGLVQVEEPFPEPMLLAATVEATDGLVVRGVNGQGRLAEVPDTARYDRRHTHCDVLVVGAGPAGLVAARTAARAGRSVVLVDDRPTAGGTLTGTETIDGRPSLEFVADTVAELAALGVVHLQRTTAFGHYDDGFVLALERRGDCVIEMGPRTRQRVHRIRAGRVVVAAGAIERPVVVEDNDRPGVMLAASARDLLHRHGVLAGREVVVFTSDDAAYAAATDLADAGARVRVLDARERAPQAGRRRCEDRGIPVETGTLVHGTRGEDRVTAALVGALTSSERREVPCDLLLVSGGWNPAAHLASHVGGSLAYDPVIGAFRPGELPPDVAVVGAANGTFALADILREAGGPDAPVAPPEEWPEPTLVLWRTPGDPTRQFVDVARDATVADVERAVGAGMTHPEHVKRYTTIGTAHDQGKTSGIIALGILAELTGRPIQEVGTTTARPPYTPVAFAALAGRERGDLFDPVRTTALHAWHVAAGAEFEDVGQWQRARHYPQAGEDMTAAVLRECAAVRTSVGIMDASTLGKIDVRGPDAPVLLDRLYTNLMSSLKVGRVRYGVMCGNDGMVFDDGTVLRLAEDRYLVTTTTGNAAAVLDWMEEWLQTEWPDLRVRLTSVTEQWSIAAVAGPRSRDVIGTVFADVDVSNEAFGFMTWQDTSLDGVPVRLARISFSGELAFEVTVSSWYAPALWERLVEAGAPHGITPYGTETMHVLRAEKGYPIIGQDTDGTVSPHDLGMAWAVSKKKDDFVGKRSYARPENRNPLRKQLVSLLPTDGATRLPEGSQIVAHCDDGRLPPAPVPMLGHVTSSYHSAALARPFALALVKGGRERLGEVVHVPVGDELVAARIGESVLVDPEGARRDG
ncbi:2Fe-2S iron-sulfur cluster-binding protein [Actinomycetospora lemnae]|uniref:2Fe-2S iron-sulfur cluster-binding protein n=1 Tax=Actinomycetospora lemnae TaxID=3019891 RepID=A0ABT5T2I4_9PSEU|nr:2Fe-2S iron-sulfur cluster-binding protein [Actinomycetospora sp. DW7H6]MDD7968915.1 2Fe-2S iron-sulfur cluster-binding protein [Actinomycetospora sp. DW7H6]